MSAELDFTFPALQSAITYRLMPLGSKLASTSNIGLHIDSAPFQPRQSGGGDIVRAEGDFKTYRESKIRPSVRSDLVTAGKDKTTVYSPP